MAAQSTRPKLAVIVANTITGDSRVQKIALSAAQAGWDVALIGRSLSGEIERTWYGPVKVIRVPVKREMTIAETARRGRSRRARLTQAGLPTAEALNTARAVHQSRTRARSERISLHNGTSGAAQRVTLKAWNRLLQKGFAARIRLFEWEDLHRGALDLPIGDWRRDYPQLLDLDLALGPIVERLRPDIIHANDITMMAVAVTSAGRLRAAGHTVSWVYDAHEYVAGVEWPTPRMASALPQLERETIHRADAVVTVSPEIAELVRKDHRLKEMPLVVRNVPARGAVGTGRESVRVAARVSDNVPLLVYSGYIHPERSIGTAVEALPLLPDFHFAIVSNQANPELRSVLRTATSLGVRHRVHVVPYVAQHDVADYLSSADLGVILSKKTLNYEMSLPTKLAEYLHAGLPVVVSELTTLSAFVRENHVGEIFTSGDPQSFRDAVLRAMPRRDALKANISDVILQELSWEQQIVGLLNLYTGLARRAPQPSPVAESGWDLRERPRGVPGRGKRARGSAPPRQWRPLTRTPVRLGLGPANFAGQLAAFARAVTDARPDVSAEVFMNVGELSFGYPADVYIKRKALRKLETQLEQVRRIVPNYTHLIVDAFYPVFGKLNGDDISGDLAILRQARIKVGLLAHGSEIRHPVRHMERVPHSLFRDAPQETIDKLITIAERNKRIADESGLPTFVTTTDLLNDLPQATWLPLVVNVDEWASDRPVMERERPKVLHAPSKRWTKGTDRFISQLEALDAKKAIQLQVVEGVKWRAMRDLVQDADIIVDQFAVGAYGTFACEAMAAGKPVLAFLTEQVEQAIGETPPIVNVSSDAVGAAVERLVDDRDEAIRLGNESSAYTRKYHDGRETARRLSSFLEKE